MRRSLIRGWLAFLTGMSVLAAAAGAEVDVGKPVPRFDSLLLDGRTLKGDDLAGKVTLVVFWATWCPVCRKELPQLQQIYRRHRARGFELLALSIDAERLEVDEFWNDHKYTFPVALRSERHSAIFGITETPPRFFLIDRQGKLRLRHLGEISGGKLEAQLLRLL